MQEIIEFIKNQIDNPFRNIFILPDRKRKILCLIYCFLKGDLSIREFLQSLLPVTRRPVNISQKRQQVINKNLAIYLHRKDLLSNENYISLFGKPFRFINLEDALGSISELIIYDEYNLRDIIKDNSVIFDIGANVGVFSVFAANLAKNGIVYAFEPVSETYKVLETNSTFYKNIKCFKLGLGAIETEVEIFIRSWSPGDATIYPEKISRPKQSFDVKEKIKILPLDIFIQDEKINKIDFVKIDVEGYELNVLKGGIKTIKKFKPIVAISLHHIKIKQLIEKFITENFQGIYKIISSTKNKNDIFLCPLKWKSSNYS